MSSFDIRNEFIERNTPVLSAKNSSFDITNFEGIPSIKHDTAPDIRSTFMAGDGYNADHFVQAEYYSKELDIPRDAALFTLPQAQSESLARKIEQDPVLVQWAAQDRGNVNFLMDDADNMLAASRNVDAILAAPPPEDLGFFDKFTAQYELGNMETELSNVAGKFAAAQTVEEREALRKQIYDMQVSMQEKQAIIGDEIIDYAHPSVVAKWLPQLEESLSYMPKNIALAAPYGMSIGAMTGFAAGSAFGGAGALPGAAAGAVTGLFTSLPTAFTMSNFENTSNLERNLFIAQMSQEKDYDGNYIPVEEMNTFASVYGLAAASVELVGITGAAKVLGITDLIQGLTERQAKDVARGYIQRALKDKTMRPMIMEFAGSVAAGAAIEGTEEMAQQYLSNLSEMLLKENVGAGFKDVDLTEGLGKSFFGGAGMGLWLGGGVRIPALIHDARQIRTQQKFTADNVAAHAEIEPLMVRQAPQIAESFLQSKFPEFRQDVYVPADAVLEYAQQGVDMVTPLEMDMVQLQEAAALGQDVPVRLARAHARLDSPTFEAFSGIMKKDVDGLNAVDVAQYEQRVTDDAARLQQEFVEYEQSMTEFEAEMVRFESELTASIQNSPMLQKSVNRNGGTANYVRAQSELLRRGVERLAERSGISPAEILRKLGVAENATPNVAPVAPVTSPVEKTAEPVADTAEVVAEVTPEAMPFDAVDGGAMAWNGVEGKVLKSSVQSPVLSLSDGTELPVTYEVREASSLIPSHDPSKNFAKRGDYPQDTQERPYHSSVDEQLKVRNNATNIKPELLLTDNPDAVNGPPMMTEDGIVLGGNSRAMTLQLAYAERPESAQKYKDALKSRAAMYGFNEADIDGMQSPVLVRVLQGETQDMPKLVRLMNQSFTQGLNENAQAVSKARMVSEDSLDVLAAGMEEHDTLLQFLATKDSFRLVDSLQNDGVIESTQRESITNKATGLLNDGGKKLVQTVLRGRAIPDYDIIEALPPSIVQKVDRILADVATLQSIGGNWDLTDTLLAASRQIVMWKNSGHKNIETYFGQKSLIPDPEKDNPIVQGMALALVNKKPTEFQKAFNEYANGARQYGTNKPFLPGMKVPTQKEIFDKAFFDVDTSLLQSMLGVGDDAMQDLYQGAQTQTEQDESQARGKISYFPKDDKYIISLFDKADLSTVTHELSHFFFKEMEAMYKAGLGDAQFRNDMEALSLWLNDGREDLPTEWNTDKHEKLARAMEQYLRDGNAPTKGLRSMFARFSRWLKNVYKHAMQLSIDYTPEVKDIFDRMLATEWEIEAAAQKSGIQNYTKPEIQALGIEEADTAFFASLTGKAKEEAEAKLSTARKRARAAFRKHITQSVNEEVDNMPVYMAIDDLNKDGIDSMELDAIMGGTFANEFAAKFRGKVKQKGGKNPQEIAAKHGFEDVESFLEAALAADNKREVKKRMIEDRLSYEDQRFAAEDFLFESNAFATQRAQVATALSKKLQNQPLSDKAVRQEAERATQAKTVRQVSNLYAMQANARSNYRKEREALLREDYEAAQKHNTNARVGIYMTIEGRKVEEAVQKLLKEVKRFTNMKKANPVARYYVDVIASAFGMKKLNEQQAAGKDMNAVKEWAAEVGMTLDDDVFKKQGTGFRDLTVEQFMVVADEIKRTIHMEREARLIETEQGRVEMDVLVQQMTQSIYANNKLRKNTLFQEKSSLLSKLNASLLKIDTITALLDGDKPMGIMWRNIFDRANEATYQFNTRAAEAKKTLTKIFSVYSKRELTNMRSKKFKHPALGNMVVTKEQLIGMALNTGNIGNMTRLKNGFGLSDEQVFQALEVLDKKDWDFVQSIWDFYETYREESFLQEEQLTGVRPKEVKATPLDTKHGQYRGGYFPVKYHADSHGKAPVDHAPENQKNAFNVPSVPHGSLKERKGEGLKGVPLDLTLDVIPTTIASTLHNLSFRKPVRDISRILRRDEIHDAIKNTVGIEQYKAIQDWLLDLAGGERYKFDGVEKFFRYARTSQSIMSMGLRIGTIVQQTAGLLSAVPEIGTVNALNGAAIMLKNIHTMGAITEETKQRSRIMAYRIENMDREIADFNRRILDSKGGLDYIKDNAFTPMGYVQFYAADMPTWWGAYEKGLKDFKGDETQAAKYADMVVERTQASGAKKDLARIQRGGEGLKLVTMYYTFFSAQYQILYRRSVMMGREPTLKNAMALANYFLIGMILQNIITDLLAGRGPDEEKDEGYAEWLLRINMTYPIQFVPILRDVVNGVMSGYGYKFTPAQTGLEAIVRAGIILLNDSKEFISGGFDLDSVDFDKKDAFLLVKAAGYATSNPLLGDGVMGMVREFTDYLDGTDPEFEAWRIIYGKRND